MSSKRNVFIRESSGLLKQVNLLDAVMLNIGNMSAGVTLFESISPYINNYPGGVLWLASIIGLVFAFPQLLVYTYMTRKMGRTGGDYVWISRNLNGAIGSTMAIALMLESVAYFALVAFFSASSINAVLYTIGSVDNSPSLVSLSNNVFVNPYNGGLTFEQKALFYGIAAAFFVIVILLNIFRSRWGYSIVTGFGIVSLSTLVIAMIVIGASAGRFGTAITPFLNSINSSLVNVYQSSPHTAFPTNFSIVSTVLLLPLFALYTYPWMQAGPAVSAEFKQSDRVAKFNLVFALLLTAILVTGGFLEMDLVAGYPFNFVAYPYFIYNFWTVAIALAGNPALQWLIGIGAIAWNFFVLAYGIIVFSRYVFALSFDRILPEKFAEVNRFGSPVYAHALDLTITLLFLLVPVFSLNAALSLYGATILGSIYFLVASTAGAIYGLRNRAKAISVAGVISALYFAFLTYEAATNPLFGFTTSTGSVNLTTLIFVVGVLVVGFLVYLVSNYRNKKKGIDISLVFKEIPPE
ncbi:MULTISPECIES: APC family permease [Metallosphaera]|uniref:Amino acid/polyamine/organocation transporter, APC superfamily n=3 Tax=Metallosphaera TaxID=41980 RepID=A4YGV8_METS5|nr:MULTISPECIES: APC family permease [Metallosphaera]ABP95660.1 amino acid/polyamine/organocation transporter, APC superfamily [Metallosphaera sedula DSM 5348]AIM27644.1 amino acid/polyamine/organocation transporter, APC superfamily [Metallosphaera sedula]AKV74500.1 amino acid permease [Metallosphaera sedula]AKV76739.1 amino acid permease [Metallosphaera sedula]AKV78990.1 amino acid permease [Metallosphaera sedula]